MIESVQSAADGNTVNLGVTDVDQYVAGADIDDDSAILSSGIGYLTPAAEAGVPTFIGATADTLDLELQATSTAPNTGQIRIFAILMDVDDLGDQSTVHFAAKGAAEIGGDAQQKGEKPAEPMKKIKKVSEEEDHESDEDSEVIEEAAMPRTKMKMLKAMYHEMEQMKAKDLKANYGKIMSAMHPEGAHEDDEDEDMQEMKKLKAAKHEIEEKIKSISVKEDVDALVEGEDLSEDFKEKASTIFEAAVKSKTRDEIARLYQATVEEFDEKLEEAKEDMTDKIDTYLNYVVEEWTKENELAIERGLKGEIAEDFISGLKQLFEDHYIDVPDEKYDVLGAQSDKIAELEDKVNEVLEQNIALKDKNGELVREHVVVEVSEDLTDTEVEKFKSLVEDMDFVDEDTFRAKLDTLKENYFPKVREEVDTEQVIDNDHDGAAQDISVSDSMSKYMNAITKTKARAS